MQSKADIDNIRNWETTKSISFKSWGDGKMAKVNVLNRARLIRNWLIWKTEDGGKKCKVTVCGDESERQGLQMDKSSSSRCGLGSRRFREITLCKF